MPQNDLETWQFFQILICKHLWPGNNHKILALNDINCIWLWALIKLFKKVNSIQLPGGFLCRLCVRMEDLIRIKIDITLWKFYVKKRNIIVSILLLSSFVGICTVTSRKLMSKISIHGISLNQHIYMSYQRISANNIRTKTVYCSVDILTDKDQISGSFQFWFWWSPVFFRICTLIAIKY